MEITITDKIKAMFQFIEFLHSNIETFKQFDEVISELYLLDEERNNLSPRKNFIDKQKYDKVQAEIENKFKVIQENIIFPIRNKAIELDIDNFQNEPSFNWNGIESDIHNIKKNFNNEDIPEILKHKGKYLKFRTETNCKYFQDHFFNSLDRILKELFDFFKESSENEFEPFETKAIQVNNIREAAEQIQKGCKKITIPIDFLKPSKAQQNNSEHLPPQQTEILKKNSEITLSEIKRQAIFETNYFFSENYSIEPNPNQLDDLIQTFDKDIEINLKHNYELIKQGRKEDLKNELTTYIKGIEKLLIKYETNHLGCVSNPKPLNKVKAYCELKYYYLFHSHFLSILNTPEPSATNIPPATEPPNEDKADETTEQAVRRILTPLTEKGSAGTVILDYDSFEILVNAYINWNEKQELPKPQNVIFYGSNSEFYGTLKELHRKMKIPNDKEICKVLQRLLTKNNSKGQRGQRVYASTIEKNLRTRYKK